MPLPRLKGKAGHGGSSWAGGGSKGLFSPVVSCSWLRRSIAPRQSEARAANQLCQVPPARDSCSHPRSCPGRGNNPCESFARRGGGSGGGNIKARSKRRRAKRSFPPISSMSLASLSSWGFPGLWAQSCSTAGAGELWGQLMAEGGGGGAGQGRWGERGRAKLL